MTSWFMTEDGVAYNLHYLQELRVVEHITEDNGPTAIAEQRLYWVRAQQVTGDRVTYIRLTPKRQKRAEAELDLLGILGLTRVGA